jgi:hypothetical protein
MSEKKLDCCVVRDLLPSYLEDLTEPETAEQVKAHLAGCEACSALAAQMGAQVPVEKAPKRALRFLRQVKRTRLLAALMALLLALLCMWWLYDREFHYANTEAGRLAAVEDYVPDDKDAMYIHVAPGTPLRVVAYAEQGSSLYIAYAAENEDHVHGVMTLRRGINGKYRPIRASKDPFPYTAGVFWDEVMIRKGERQYVMVGDGCREIYAVRVEMSYVSPTGSGPTPHYEATIAVPEPDFMRFYSAAELNEIAEVGEEVGYLRSIWTEAILDKDGSDVTDQYRDGNVPQNWSSGKGTAELGVVYVYMAIAALLGVVFIRYFLRRD